jgi:UDP-N-acetylmuramoyl-tripeptide--D-alanyl-D-alanine ligase
MKRTLQAFAALCGGRLEGGDAAYTQVNTDTRSLQPGELYLALRGPRFDGHDFLDAAAKCGAVGAVVERFITGLALPQVVVADTQQALTAAAAGWRMQYPGCVLAVAGSNGKTTTKEMLAAILSQRGACLATRGNLNNHIGVPLTLLRLEPGHEFAVIETGANRAGEVAALAALARPRVGLVTNAGAEHLEGFGDLDGVARAEGEMFAALDAEGVAIINADDAYATLWRGMTRARVVSFGLSAAADFRAEDVTESLGDAGFELRFTLVSPLGRQALRLQLGGRHNVLNALAAAAAACSAGASLAQVAAGLAQLQPVQGRLQPRRSRHGARLLDDSYNANPSSVRAGIDVVTGLGLPAWLVLGDMGELGTQAESSHVEIGAYAREHGIRRLFATGPLSRRAVEAFGQGAQWYPDAATLAQAVDHELDASVCVLVKGSRSNRLERVVATLTGAAAPQGH